MSRTGCRRSENCKNGSVCGRVTATTPWSSNRAAATVINRSHTDRGACIRRALTDNLRFLLALGGVAVGAALFASAFRSSLGWLYRFCLSRRQRRRRHHEPATVVTASGPGRWRRPRGLIARLRNAPSQNVSNVMEAGSVSWRSCPRRSGLFRTLAEKSASASLHRCSYLPENPSCSIDYGALSPGLVVSSRRQPRRGNAG